MKKLCAVVLTSIIMLSFNTVVAQASFDSGNFVPCANLQSIATDSRIKLYSVREGDTLWGISREHNVDLQTVLAINNLDVNSVLGVGQMLEIPYNRFRIYVIRNGDTLWDIASRYDVNINDLIALNNNKNPKQLKVGDKIWIPGSMNIQLAMQQSPSRNVSLTYTSLSWPLIGEITSPYGWRKSGFHHGLDIAGNIGDAIKAAAPGTISFAGYRPVYGNIVVIDHYDGKQTVYAHARNILVSRNQKVNQGDIIATVGISGVTTGPHLHFEVRENEKTDDPLKYLRYK